MKTDNSKLPRGVLDEKELEEISKEEIGLKEAVEGKIDRKSSTKDDKNYDSLIIKIEAIEKGLKEIKSETDVLRENLKEQSEMLVELTKYVKELKEKS